MRHRGTLTVAVAFALIGGSGMAVAQASETVTHIYVDNTNTSCNDGGSGTQAAPYCTIQSAFDAVQAGQTVQILAGDYTRTATLTASGTASAPITVQFGKPGQPFSAGTSPIIDPPQGSAAGALTVSGASYVDIDQAAVIAQQDPAPAIAVQNSSHVQITAAAISTTGAGGGVAVSGTGSDVTLERGSIEAAGTAVSVAGAGVTGTVITTNAITGADGVDTSGGIAVDGASGTDVVSNTVSDTCTSGVSVSGLASGTLIENNVISVDEFAGDTGRQCPTTAPNALGLSVASDSTAGTTEKYDTIALYQSTPVEWAGTAYTSAGDYQAASGQGANDLLLTGSAAADVTTVPADYVDSADAAAVGELSTDFHGKARVDDPIVSNTGTGVGYYDRGATELQDAFAAVMTQVTATHALGVSVAFIVGLCGSWGATTFTGSVAWGDGQSTAESGSGCSYEGGGASHTYAKPGDYTITFTGTDGYTSQTNSEDVVTDGSDYTPYGPTRILDTRKGTGAPKAPVVVGSFVKLKIAGNGGIPADVTSVAVNLTVTDATGDGSVATSPDGEETQGASNIAYTKGQTVADSAIVRVPLDGYIDVYNEGATGSADLIADVIGYFTPTAASGYQPVPLSRILDTRKGTGAKLQKVPADSGIPVAVDGVDSIPSGATAVAVHVTVADTTGGGWIAAEPDGAGVPGSSILNYGTGQVISNTVFVPVASDGKIELYNGGTTPVDLIADVSRILLRRIAERLRGDLAATGGGHRELRRCPPARLDQPLRARRGAGDRGRDRRSHGDRADGRRQHHRLPGRCRATVGLRRQLQRRAERRELHGSRHGHGRERATYVYNNSSGHDAAVHRHVRLLRGRLTPRPSAEFAWPFRIARHGLDQVGALVAHVVDVGAHRVGLHPDGGGHEQLTQFVGVARLGLEPGPVLVGGHDQGRAVVDAAELVGGLRGQDGAGPQPRIRIVAFPVRVAPQLVEPRHRQRRVVRTVDEVRLLARLLALLPRGGLLPLVEAERRKDAAALGERLAERGLLSRGLDPRVDQPIADREVLRPRGHQAPAQRAQLPFRLAAGRLVARLAGEDREHLLGGRDVVVRLHRPVQRHPVHAELLGQLFRAVHRDVPTAHTQSLRPVPRCRWSSGSRGSSPYRLRG